MLKRMRKQVERERDFTAFSSHEMRTPLTVMRGNLDILLEIDLNKNQSIAERAFVRMDSATRRMTGICSSFLWLAREHSAQQEHEMTRFTRCDLEKVLEFTLENVSEQQRERVFVDIDSIDWQVRHDMLTIVVDNLIRNALQHSSKIIYFGASRGTLFIANITDGELSDAGNGIGIKIVRRICESSGWTCVVKLDDNSFNVTIDVMAAEPSV
jgi:signal transduction histidine kinase